MRLEGQIDFEKIDLKKPISNQNDIIALDKDDILEAMKIFIQWRAKARKDHKGSGKPKSNALSEASESTKPINKRMIGLVPNALNQKRSTAPEPKSDLSFKQYFFDKLASKS